MTTKNVTPRDLTGKLHDLRLFLKSHLNALGTCAAALRAENYEEESIRAGYVVETLDDYILEKLREEIDDLDAFMKKLETPPDNSTEAMRPDKEVRS